MFDIGWAEILTLRSLMMEVAVVGKFKWDHAAFSVNFLDYLALFWVFKVFLGKQKSLCLSKCLHHSGIV